MLATVDALRGLDVAAASVQVLGPTDGRALVVAPDDATRSPTRWRSRTRPGARVGRVRVAVDPPRV